MVRYLSSSSHPVSRLWICLVTNVAALLSLGVIATVYAQQREEAVASAASESFPSFVAAHDIRTALAETDLLAAQTFLTGGVERLDLQQSYQAELSGAINKVTTYADTSDNAANTRTLAAITDKISAYSALIGQARAYRRDGVPLGAAYLRRASSIMQREVIPLAEQLVTSSAEELNQDYRRASHAYQAVTVTVLAGTVLAALLLTQLLLAMWSKRIFNIPLVLATAAAMFAMATLAWAWSMERTQLSTARDQGYSPMALLSQSRSLALRARSDEVLFLIARGSGAVLLSDFDSVLQELGYDPNGVPRPEGSLLDVSADGRTGADGSEAAELLKAYLLTHTRIQELDDLGEYNAAVEFTLDPDPLRSGGVFAQLDAALTRDADTSRKRFEDTIVEAKGTLRLTRVLVPPLLGLAVVLCTYGYYRRIKEYQ